MAKKETVYTATGRRKRAVAQVILKAGNGKITVNGVDVNDYLPNKMLVMDLKQPLELTGTADSYDVDVVVRGGGFTGQTGAIRLGIARALMEADREGYRPTLKGAGMVTRDARIKERKKYGLKKARRAPQFSKR